MYPSHSLFQSVRIPWDIIVDHQVTELEVDTLSRRFRGDQHIALVFKNAFRLNSVFQSHSAVDDVWVVSP